ncbi:MAG: hypothetical protein JWQ09_399 [Segetibacter sp.]|nr:hypothetical protein [Segetibacter sp.]
MDSVSVSGGTSAYHLRGLIKRICFVAPNPFFFVLQKHPFSDPASNDVRQGQQHKVRVSVLSVTIATGALKVNNMLIISKIKI